MHDQRVELAERLAAEVADVAQRRLRVAHLPGLGLHHHRGHVVADHVVQLAGQAGALLEPGGPPAQLVGLVRQSLWVRSRDRSSSPRLPPKTTPRNAENAGWPRRTLRTSETKEPSEPAGPADPRDRAQVLGDGPKTSAATPSQSGTASALVNAATNAAPAARTVERHGWLGSDASTDDRDGVGRPAPCTRRCPAASVDTSEMTAAPPPAAYATRRSRCGSSSTRRDSLIRSVSATEGVLSYVRREIGTRVPVEPGARGPEAPRGRHRGPFCERPGRATVKGMTNLPCSPASTAGRTRACRLPGRPLRHRPERRHRWSAPCSRCCSAAIAVAAGDLRLLAVAYAVYWVGDIADGWSARRLGQETRAGAVFDIVCDRACTGMLCVGLVASVPDALPVVVVFVLSFMVLDTMLSLAFLCWPVVSPNYFHVVDRRVWQLNWSPVAKAANTAGVVGALALERTPSRSSSRPRGRRRQGLVGPPRRSGCSPPRDGEPARRRPALAVVVGVVSALLPLINAEAYALVAAGADAASR